MFSGWLKMINVLKEKKNPVIIKIISGALEMHLRWSVPNLLWSRDICWYRNLPKAIPFQSQTHMFLPFQSRKHLVLPFKHCHWTPSSGHHWVTIASVKAISAVFGHSVYLRFRDTTTNNALTTIGVGRPPFSQCLKSFSEKWCVCWGLGTWCYLSTSTNL